MEKRVQDYKNDILSIIRSKISPAILSKKLQDFHENDIAEVMPELNSAERCKLYRILDIDTLSDIMEYMEEEEALYYLEFKLGKPVEESVIDLFGQREGNGRVFFTPRQMAWLYYEAIPDDQKKNFLKKVENQAIEIQQKDDMILISYTGNFIE